VLAPVEERARGCVGPDAGRRRRQHDAKHATGVPGGHVPGYDAPEGHAVDVGARDARGVQHRHRVVGELRRVSADVQRQHPVTLAEHGRGPQAGACGLAGPGDQEHGVHQNTGSSV
jgi:hypothetical protein